MAVALQLDLPMDLRLEWTETVSGDLQIAVCSSSWDRLLAHSLSSWGLLVANLSRQWMLHLVHCQQAIPQRKVNHWTRTHSSHSQLLAQRARADRGWTRTASKPMTLFDPWSFLGSWEVRPSSLSYLIAVLYGRIWAPSDCRRMISTYRGCVLASLWERENTEGWPSDRVL